MAKFELNKLEDRVDILGDIEDVVQLQDIMTKDVVTGGKDASIFEAAKLMEARDVSCIVIVEGDAPAGIVTERDMVRKVIIQDIDKSANVETIMTSPVATAEMTEEVTSGAKLMVEKGIRRLPVVANGKLAGIVTATDILNLF